MKVLATIAIILAFGPTVFDLALTGRGVSRPTQTSTTDWALTQFYALHTGKPSLAIPPTGLVGAALTVSDHNSQDSTVPIWTTVHVTSRRALANVGSFITNFNRRQLDWQWRYIRGWWRFNSGRVIEEVLIIYIYSLPLLTVILTIWRKRVLRRRRLEAERTVSLVQPSLASFAVVKSLVRTDLIQTTRRNVHPSSCIQNVNNIVAIGGTPTPSPFHPTHHLAFDFRGRLRVVSTPAEYPAKFIPPQLLGALTAYTGTVSVYKKLRLGQEQVSRAPTASTRIKALGSGPKGSKSQRIVVITLLVLLEGFVIIHYEAVNGIAFWTVTIILSPGSSCASAVSRYAGNIYRIVPKRAVTFRASGLIEAGSLQSNVPSIYSPTPRRLFRSDGMALPRTSLASEIGRRAGGPLPSHKLVVQEDGSPEEQRASARVSTSFISIHSVEGVLVMGCSLIGEVLHWSICFFPRQEYHISQHTNNDGALPTQSTSADATLLDILLREKSVYTPWISRLAGILALDVPGETVKGRLATTEVDITAIPLPPSMPYTPTTHAVSDVEPEAQVVLAPSADTGDTTKVEEAEEESEDNNLVKAAFFPLPPSRPASPEAEEVSDQVEEELLQATFIPLPDSRPGSPELHTLDPSTRNSDLHQHISTLSHQYFILRATVFRPVLPEEARAIRAELRPRLCSLAGRARERRGLASFTSVEVEPEGQEEVVVMVEEDAEEVVVEEDAEEEEEEEEEVEEDLEIDPSTENQDVGNVGSESRRPFRLEIPISVIRHISTNIH